jgi:hypothetical protein
MTKKEFEEELVFKSITRFVIWHRGLSRQRVVVHTTEASVWFRSFMERKFVRELCEVRSVDRIRKTCDLLVLDSKESYQGVCIKHLKLVK